MRTPVRPTLALAALLLAACGGSSSDAADPDAPASHEAAMSDAAADGAAREHSRPANHDAGAHDGSSPHGKHAPHDGAHGNHPHDGAGPHGDPHAKHPHGDPHAKGDHATVHHRFDDAQKWAKVFDDPERDSWQRPAELIAALQIAPGSAVADIGAGTGYFNTHLAKAVGPEGTVIAVDVEQSLVDHMTKRAATEQTPQVQARLGAFDDPKLAPAEVDLVLLVDTYHHIGERVQYFSRLAETLKPGGRLVIVDFIKDKDIPVGPKPGHRIAASKVQAELTDAGWVAQPSIDVLPYQYVLVFGRN